MDSSLTRKGFLHRGAMAIGAAFIAPQIFAQTTTSVAPGAPNIPDRGPQIDRELVRQFVIAGHANLDKVKEMLTSEPALVNGTWDWGKGDFETALGGASHMGRPDIAQYLLEHGARMDLFAAAMLGKIDVVKAVVTAFPDIVRVPGPHKIPLIAHAEKGGANAVAVVEFLRPLVA